MNAAELIDALHKAGATLAIEEGKTRVRGAKVEDALLAQLKEHKAEVIAEWNRRQAEQLDRYCTVPAVEVPMLGRDIALKPAEAQAVMGYVLRQPKPVHAWMQSRANAYHVLGVPVAECERCACADLLAWQRNLDGKRAVQWLMGIEECAANLPAERNA